MSRAHRLVDCQMSTNSQGLPLVVSPILDIARTFLVDLRDLCDVNSIDIWVLAMDFGNESRELWASEAPEQVSHFKRLS